MDIPILRKAVAFTDLPSISVAVRPVMPFDKGGVNGATDGRCFDSSFDIAFAPKDNSQLNVDYTPL